MGIIERIKVWLQMLKPEGTDAVLKQYKGKGDLKESLINYLIGSAIISAMIFILYLLIFVLFASLFAPMLASAGNNGLTAAGGTLLMAVLIAALVGVVCFIGIPILSYISQGVYWILAKILGGKGTYTEQTFFGSMLGGAFAVIAPAIIVVSLIPCLGTIVSFVVGAYELYLAYKIIKTVHGLDQLRAAVVVLLPLVVLVGLYLLIYLFAMFYSISSPTYVS
ncbi:MAG: YIP1 family protein [Candidatus Micrarchaeia archaeon]|jgi:hypothetical protein